MKTRKRFILIIVLLIICFGAQAQKKYSSVEQKHEIPTFKVHPIKLPAEVLNSENQYSGLAIHQDSLYLMSESRIGSPAFLDRASLKDLLTQEGQTVSFDRIPVLGLSTLMTKMQHRGNMFEGLEAMTCIGNTFYFTIETTTHSDSCYVISGQLRNNQLHLSDALLSLRKPLKNNAEKVENAGFEALTTDGKQLFAFFEYNGFDHNYYATFDAGLSSGSVVFHSVANIPYRLTDVYFDQEDQYFYGLNFFYKREKEYWLKPKDPYFSTIYDGKKFHNFCQLLMLKPVAKKIKPKVFGVLPKDLWGYNFEGLVKYKNGFFIINDKYTPDDIPKATCLFYLSY